MPYQIESFPNGKTSVRNSALSESMHSSIGPWEEANLIYIGQSCIEERLNPLEVGPLVVYDVGLGIAANALALIQTTLQKTSGNLHLISFENDLEGLKFALNKSGQFPFLCKIPDLIELVKKNFLLKADPKPDPAPRRFEYKSKSGQTIQWELRTGDFLHEIAKPLPPPELIYFDFYSPKSSPQLWSYKVFRQLYEITAPRRQQNQNTTLLTYSSSTAVRSAMILAGFQVGYGIQTAAKFETTQATTCSKNLSAPLGEKWIHHLKRSSKPVPTDHKYATQSAAITEVIKAMEQWEERPNPAVQSPGVEAESWCCSHPLSSSAQRWCSS